MFGSCKIRRHEGIVPTDTLAKMETLEPRLCLSSDTSINTAGVAATDMNGDGKVDLILSLYGRTGGVNVRLGNGHGAFGRPLFVSTYSFARGATIDFADLNRDNKQDLVIYGGQGASNGSLFTMLGNGDGTFKPPVRTGGALFAGAPVTGVLNNTYLDVADINNDGILDVVITDPRLQIYTKGKGSVGSYLYYLLGNGDGTLQDGVAVPTG
jgi:FG-GAP-like repeat